MEVLAFRALNPGATLTTVTDDQGSPHTIRDAPEAAAIWLEELWAQNATAGEVRVISPKLHDNTQGLRFQSPAGAVRSFLGDEVRQRLYANDPLTIQVSGGGAETDCVGALVYYDDITGIQQNLHTWEEVQPRIIEFMGHLVQVTGPTTAGDWSAGNALNSFSSQMKADETYALLGYLCATTELAIGLVGADTGGLRIGGPGPTEAIETRDWFTSLARATGKPCIPFIKANNFASSTLAVARATTGGTDNVTLLFARLSK
jgi:hypothetical protein